MKCSLVSLIFLMRSLLVFPFCFFPLFLCIVHLGRLSYLSLLFFGTLHSNGCIFSPWPFIPLPLIAICKLSSHNHFAFLFWGIILIIASCTMSQTSAHCSLGMLSDLIPWIYFSLPLYSRILFSSYLNGLVVFSTLFNLSLNLVTRGSWSEPQSAPSLVFADGIEPLHVWLQRT